MPILEDKVDECTAFPLFRRPHLLITTHTCLVGERLGLWKTLEVIQRIQLERYRT